MFGIWWNSSTEHARSGDIKNDYFAVFKDSLHESDLAAWKQTTRYIEAIQALCGQMGSKLLILIVPTGNQLNREEWLLGKQYWKFDADEQLESTTLQERAMAMSIKVRASSLDLLPVFSSASGPDHRVYFSLDGHWTEYGHEIAAKSILDFLTTNDWLVSAQ